MEPRLPIVRDLVLVGGGHAHALLLRRWAMRPLPGARVTVIAPGPLAAYSGMLPGCLAGHYHRNEIHIDLVPLARAAGARLILGAASGLDRTRRRVRVDGRPPVDYDALSINIGALTPRPEGAEDHPRLLSVKPTEPFLDGWEAFLSEARRGARVVVIGAGLGGVETALAMRWRLRLLAPKVILLERGQTILPELPPGARPRFTRALKAASVETRFGAGVAALSPEGAGLGVALENGASLEADLVVSTAGATPPAWLAGTDLAKDARGFLEVDQYLRSPTDPLIFAAGDVAAMSHAPRPKAGVFAVRQAPALHDNLQRLLSGRPLERFQPQGAYLKLAALGPKRAIAEKWGLTLEGGWVWRWKDSIDRRFMRRLADLPQMDAAPEAPARAASGLKTLLERDPLCGACGAKIGYTALDDAFASLGAAERAVFANRLGDDAAPLPPGRGRRVISTDHLRAFTEDAYLHARVTAIHALGDLWAMGAAPEYGLLSVTLPAMAEEKQAAALAETLSGIAAVFGPEEAQILGGHSSEGPEAVIGLTVIGAVAEGAPIGQQGAEAGCALILTKPIGVGVILAGEMRGETPGPAYRAALDSMLRPSGAAARILAEQGALAMTDVTGFGLAGHLGRMVRAAGLDAEIALDEIPCLDGAVDLARKGVRSSLFESNAALGAPLLGPAFDPSDPRVALLLDPQTAGGLLAALPAEAAGPALDALAAAGVAARVIGRTEPQAGERAAIRLA